MLEFVVAYRGLESKESTSLREREFEAGRTSLSKHKRPFKNMRGGEYSFRFHIQDSRQYLFPVNVEGN